MAYQVLARKWRPKKFDEVVGQHQIVTTLQNSILNNKVAHAYLFTGTRGVGKTTVARIFAKALRCENKDERGNPCLACDNCTAIENGTSIDFQEIDGASNNSVDDIRDLIESVQYLPSSGSYKVYVIDEVHMLTVNAFNALLKTLEEPPQHVVFIFATTDPQKLLGTVLSRCQRFDFKHVKNKDLESLVQKIAVEENVNFASVEVVREMCHQGHGSVRDTLSIMDQVIGFSNSNIIDSDTLLLSLGLAKTQSISSIVNSMFKKDEKQCLSFFKDVLRENIDLKKFSLQLLDQVFYVIENIDNVDRLEQAKISSKILREMSFTELMWIYEVLSKDLQWSLDSFYPEKCIQFNLLKVCKRSEIFEARKISLESKKKDNITTKTLEAVEEVVEELSASAEEMVVETVETAAPLVQEEEKSWDGFIRYLYDNNNRTIAVNLEHGNLLEPVSQSEMSVTVKLAFAESDKIFFDYLQDMTTRKKLIDEIAFYFKIDPTKVYMTMDLLDEETKEEKQFLSKVEVEEKLKKEKATRQREDILANKYIVQAEEIFNTKIGKIILNDENNN